MCRLQFDLHVPSQILDQVCLTTSKEKTLINGCINIFNYAIARSTAFIVPHIGRRKLFLASISGYAFISWPFYDIQVVFDTMLPVIIYFTWIKAHGMTLEEIATIFDGNDEFAAANATAAAEVGGKLQASVGGGQCLGRGR